VPSASSRALPALLIRERRVDFAALGFWLLAAVLVVYLALRNGGYGVVERSEVGIVVWWLVFVGAAAGVIPARRTLPRAALVILGLLAAFTAWTTLSLGWTESDERTAIEIARVVSYLGVFAVALSAQRGERWRALLGGVVSGIVAVLVLALLSRLEPTWFPEQVVGAYFPDAQLERRLAYPLNYSSGLAVLAAMAIPLLLAVAGSARRIAIQAAAAAALAVAALVLWLTASSLLAPLALIALASYLVLAPDRLVTLCTAVVALGGGAIAIAAVEQRSAFDSGQTTAAAQAQANELLAIVIVVCAGVALIQTAIGLLARHAERPAWLSASPRFALAAATAALASVVVLALATPLRGEIEDGWDRFSAPSEIDEQSASRLQEILDPSSQGRYALWGRAIDAGQSEPLTGIGAGGFEFWWARERRGDEFARDAHSLFLETFAELGIVGLILIVSFVVGVLAIGARRTVRAPSHTRLALAGATSAALVFAVGAAVDWMWELAVLPAIFMALAAVILVAGRRNESEAAEPTPATTPTATRIGVAATAIVAIVAIAIPLAGTEAVETSRAAAGEQDSDAALARADDAVEVAPYAATPELQRALVLENRGELGAAVGAAREAVERERANWRPWVILSRLEARAGNAAAAVEAYRVARSLNPRSPIFAR
jgi:O-antigen ligase